MAEPNWSEWVHDRLEAPDDVIEEIAHQLEDSYREAIALGMSEGEAQERAASEVSDWSAFERALDRSRRPQPVRRRVRQLSTSGIWQDIRYGLRGMVTSPGYTLVATVSLALGIAANTVAFSFVHSLFLEPLPVERPHELVRLYGSLTDSLDYATLSFGDYDEIRARTDLFSAVAVDKLVPLNLGIDGATERAWGFMVSGRYFSLLGISPVLGRWLDYEDDGADGKHPVAILSYAFWQRAFAGRASALTETIVVNGQAFDIIGVAPAEFNGTNVGLKPAVWLPASMSRVVMPGFELRNRSNRSFFSIARLNPGVDLDAARAGLDVLAARLRAEHPDSNRGIGFKALPERQGGIHPIMRGGVLSFSGVLVVVVALVLLVACANVAGLLLSRATYRRRELALRAALGAGRARIVRQLLTESLLLSVLAGGAGVLLAVWGVDALARLGPPLDIPLTLPLQVDGFVLAAGCAVTLLTSLLFGLTPAVHASRTNLVTVLRASGGRHSHGRARLRSGLVVAQVAMSTVLLVGAGLFVRGLQQARDAELGFDPEGLVMASVDLGLQGYDDSSVMQFAERLRERLGARAEIQSTAWANIVPFDVDISQHSVAPAGFEPRSDRGAPSVNRSMVSHDYFDLMAIPLVRGRVFTRADDAAAPPVVIVNETLAHRFWPGEAAVGQRMGRPGGTMMEVVGVVRDGKYLTLNEEPTPLFYYPLAQRPSQDLTLLVRGAGAKEPGELLDTIRGEVRDMDAGVPLYGVKTMSEHLRIALAPAGIGASVLGILAGLAIALAALGLYGVLAFAVAQRRFEIGVRRALGASASDIARRVMLEGISLAGAGLLIGVALSFIGGRAVSSLLYGLDPVEPSAFVVAVGVLATTALLSSVGPTRRALRVDPIVALRAD